MYNIDTIFIFSFRFLFILNNIIIPRPEFTSKPPISVPNPITLLINNSVNITDDAQFGISPISPAKIGPSIGLFKISPAKVIVISNYCYNDKYQLNNGDINLNNLYFKYQNTKSKRLNDKVNYQIYAEIVKHID